MKQALNFEVELVPVEEVADLLHTTPPKIRAMIINGSLPIGCAAEKTNDKERNTVRIVRRRLEAYILGLDIGGDKLEDAKETV